MKITTGDVFKTRNDGNVIVVDYINSHKILVRFVNTGYETFVQSGSLRKGQVKDRSSSQAGSVYKSNNHGEMKIIEYKTATDVTVEFIKTGYRCATSLAAIKAGNVRDYLSKTLYGVGFIGVGKYKTGERSRPCKAFIKWKNMFVRCYDNDYQLKSPTYKGCEVAEVWHNYQNFAEWFYDNYEDGLHLDKDIKVPGNKVYGPDTCTFVTGSDNTIAAKAKSYRFRSPSGDIVEIYNMCEFCRENDLSQGHMASVNTGNRNHHKGWTKA